MRDLAQQSYQRTSSSKIAIPRSAVRVALLVVVILVILLVVRRLIAGGGVIGGSSIVLRDAPKGLTPVEFSGGSTAIDDDAIDLSIQSATFTNVSGESATATATRKFGDGSYNLSVNAILPDPNGNVYQVWIVGGDEPHLSGDMQGLGKSWSLSFNDVDDYSNLDGIWISREITKQDSKPEKHILEGSF